MRGELGQESFVAFEHDLGGVLDGVFLRGLAGGRAQLVPEIVIHAQAGQLGGKGSLVRAGEQAGNTVFHGIAHADRMDAQHGQAGSHGFHNRERVHFRDGGSYENISHGEVARQLVVGQHAGEMDAAGRAALGGCLLQRRLFRSAADDQQVGVLDGFGGPGKGADEKIQVLFRSRAARKK